MTGIHRLGEISCFRSVAVLTVVSVLWTALRASFAADPITARVDFVRDVRPILQRYCVECHGAGLVKGELRLDTKAQALKGGASGFAFVAGKSSSSELLRRVSLPKGDEEVMPARGAVLSAQQVDLLRRWVDEGADWPDHVPSVKHWSYERPIRPAVPSIVDNDWARGPLDRFVAARLDTEQLTPSPQAARHTLLRRVTLDLTGLPPSVDELAEFLNDTRPDAYERLIDRLLASPAFGEKWARHWLDLARYADSHGFQRDDLHELWAFRDWVISALNEDMPFDEFTIDQIAGDLLAESDLAPSPPALRREASSEAATSNLNTTKNMKAPLTLTLSPEDGGEGTGEDRHHMAAERRCIATGFHRCSPTNVEAGSDPEETRVNQLIDRVNTTAAVWLGSTLECAQCHDHKYDPFTQRDYYGLLAFFNGTEIEADRSNPKVPGSIRFLGPKMPLHDERLEAERTALAEQLRVVKGRLDARRKELEAGLDEWALSLRKATTTEAVSGTWHVLDIADFDSLGDMTAFEILPDKSILLKGEPADKDTYTIEVRTTLRNIAAIRLETLTDPSLPGDGPGRGDAARPNFVLHEFSATATPLRPANGSKVAKPESLTFSAAIASFSQKNYDVAGAIDDDPKTAWAINPQFHKSHWAEFTLAEPIGFEQGTTVTFRLVQNFGAARIIGRLKLSALVLPLASTLQSEETKKKPAAKSSKTQPTSTEMPLSAEVLTALKVEPAQWTKAHTAVLLDHRAALDPHAKQRRAERDALDQRLRELKPDTTLVMQELATPRATTIFQRGDFRTPGTAVTPAAPAILHSLPAGPPNRLTLARWLVSPENPLVGRVSVNRWWAELFGRGLVSTVEDFGIKGEPPTHPELLDWLAVEFVGQSSTRSFSMKRLLRQITSSATYRQSSRITPELLAHDDQNRLLARGPRFRLDAEAIRDQALAVAGLLSDKQFGPPVRPYQPGGLWTKVGGTPLEYNVSPGEDRYRRGVYVVWKRASPYPSFVAFDATARLACTVKRSRSNTPLQALTLLNDPVYVEAAFGLARVALDEASSASTDSRLSRMFVQALAREPSVEEAAVLKRLFNEQRTTLEQNAHRAKQIVGEEPLPRDTSAAEFAAWQAVASALLNLDEAITKP